MDRETKTITTPISKIEVVLKAWLTGREQRALQQIFLKDVEIEATGAGALPAMKGLKGSIIEKAEDLAIETVVVSIAGKTENLIKTILDMHGTDTKFVVDHINAITQDKDFEDGKKN